MQARATVDEIPDRRPDGVDLAVIEVVIAEHEIDRLLQTVMQFSQVGTDAIGFADVTCNDQRIGAAFPDPLHEHLAVLWQHSVKVEVIGPDEVSHAALLSTAPVSILWAAPSAAADRRRQLPGQFRFPWA